jgi:hypothetical protein
MTTREQRARAIQRSIADVLEQDWDPIGVKDESEARNEYDAYVEGIYRLIVSRATVQQLAEHLARIEAEQLGLVNANAAALMHIAEKLLKLDVSLLRVNLYDTHYGNLEADVQR